MLRHGQAYLRPAQDMEFAKAFTRFMRRAVPIPLESQPKTSPVCPEHVGTTPWHTSMLFLHTTMPPSEYPSKMSSKVYRELLLRTRRTMDCSVNFSWSPTQAITTDPEAYAATAFLPSGGTIHIPEVNLTNIDDVISKMNTNVQHTAAKRDAHIYVCTHGARDCRCGDTGGQVAAALREAAAQRPLEERNRIHIAETAHVGGHKYAANVLVYPRGEWLGLVQPEDAPSVLDAIFQQSDQPFDSNLDPLLPHHWRGRMNLDKEEQIKLYDRFINSIR